MVTPFWHLRCLLPEQSNREPQLNQIIGADSPAIVHLVPLLISQKTQTLRENPQRSAPTLIERSTNCGRRNRHVLCNENALARHKVQRC